MAITEVKHVWNEPDAPNSVLHVAFDRTLTEREASEVAQLVGGLHERHEAARSFKTQDPHHVRHVTPTRTKAWTSSLPDLDDDGKQVVLGGIPQVTTSFSGTCKDCGRLYSVGSEEPYHYVCPSLPPEGHPFIKFRVGPCHAGCAIDCGRDAYGAPLKGA
jgi:hypothetical protein